MDTQETNKTMANPPHSEELNKNDGCLRGLALIGILFLALIGALALVIYLRPASLLRYGLITNINEMELRLEKERTLPPEQYEELKVYLDSLKKYIAQNKLDKNSVKRIGPVSESFKSALKDGQIGRSEIAMIRAAVWKSNIPLNVPAKQEKTMPAATGTQEQN